MFIQEHAAKKCLRVRAGKHGCDRVFKNVAENLPDGHGFISLFVGRPSSGKSTLLNAMFTKQKRGGGARGNLYKKFDEVFLFGEGAKSQLRDPWKFVGGNNNLTQLMFGVVGLSFSLKGSRRAIAPLEGVLE